MPTGAFAEGGFASRWARLWDWTTEWGFAAAVVGAGPASGLAITGVSGAIAPGTIASGATAAASSAAAVSATPAGKLGGLTAGRAPGFVPFSKRFEVPAKTIVLPFARTRNPY